MECATIIAKFNLPTIRLINWQKDISVLTKQQQTLPVLQDYCLITAAL
jgi:hypothetical protein